MAFQEQVPFSEEQDAPLGSVLFRDIRCLATVWRSGLRWVGSDIGVFLQLQTINTYYYKNEVWYWIVLSD